MDYTFTDNSTWDIDNHIAIPTIDFIKKNTGIDLNIYGDSIIGTVEGRVKMLTLDAKNELFFNKSNRVQNVLSYKMAYEREYNTNWLNYVVSYINDTFDNPDQVSTRTKQRKKLIDFYNFTVGVFSDIEESELEW